MSGGSDYQAELHAILSSPLKPEAIAHYASHALGKIVALAGSVVAGYLVEQPAANTSDTAAATEDKAFEHFGLQGVNPILEHLAREDETIRSIGTLIQRQLLHPNIATVLVPPDEGNIPQPGLTPSFSSKPRIPKLQTLMYLLHAGFDVNLEQEVSLFSGPVARNMVRETSYVLVDIPKIKRTVLICDEPENATFVFDSGKLKELTGLDPLSLADLHKSELQAIIGGKNNPGVGTVIHYSDTFVSRVAESLANITPTIRDRSVQRESTALLYPKPPDGVTAIGELIKTAEGAFGCGAGATRNMIEKLIGEGSLHPLGRYNFGAGRVYEGLYPEQRTAVLAQLAEKFHGVEPVREGEQTIGAMAAHSGYDFGTIERAIKKLGVERIDRIIRGNVRAILLPEDQQRVYAHIESYPSREEMVRGGYRHAKEIAHTWGVKPSAVYDSIERFRKSGSNKEDATDKLGEATEGRDGAFYYSEAQQEMVRLDLHTRGYFAPKAPSGAMTQTALAGELQKLGLGGRDKLKVALRNWRNEGRTIDPAPMVGASPDLYFTAEQIAEIKARLEQSGTA